MVPSELVVRLMDMQRKWSKECKTVVKMEEVIGIEQFQCTLPMEKNLCVMEKKPETCVKPGELEDEYEQVRRQEPGVAANKPMKFQSQKNHTSKENKCDFCGRCGHLESVQEPLPQDKVI